ncbi:MAG: CapA family protein [Bryobacteraceae bacterium]
MKSRRDFLLGSLALALPARTRLIFGGDVMLSRHVGRIARRLGRPWWPFHAIAPVFSEADLAFVNLESPFSDRGRPVEKGMIFKAEPEMIEGLVLANIQIVSTANNHSRDQRGYGVEFTLDWLARHGIAAAGTGRSEEAARQGVVLERNGTRFGFLAYTYDQSNGNHHDLDPRVLGLGIAPMESDVRSLRERCDAVVVSMHAGIEYRSQPSLEQRRFARAAVDAGAALVIGHHPHVIQPIERYGEGVICYSLGNLIFDQFHRRETQKGLLAEFVFLGSRIENAVLRNIDIVGAVPRLAPRGSHTI